MFQGFSDATVDFLWGIRFNNDRTWFLDHKEDYQTHLLAPMKELADEVYTFLQEQCKEYGLICRVSRIYRDARRLHGNGPYKDHLWFSIERPNEDKCNEPCFWFELSPDGVGYGCGMFQPKPATMQALRKQADQHPEELEALTRTLAAQTQFALTGDEYKRPKSTPSRDILAPWYLKKSFALSYQQPLTDVVFTPQLAQQVKDGYQFLLPYYRYFVGITALPTP